MRLSLQPSLSDKSALPTRKTHFIYVGKVEMRRNNATFRDALKDHNASSASCVFVLFVPDATLFQCNSSESNMHQTSRLLRCFVKISQMKPSIFLVSCEGRPTTDCHNQALLLQRNTCVMSDRELQTASAASAASHGGMAVDEGCILYTSYHTFARSLSMLRRLRLVLVEVIPLLSFFCRLVVPFIFSRHHICAPLMPGTLHELLDCAS